MKHEITLERTERSEEDRGSATAELRVTCSCSWTYRTFEYGKPEEAKAEAMARADAHLANPLVQDEEADRLWLELQAANEALRQAQVAQVEAQGAFTSHLQHINRFQVGDEVLALFDDKNMRRYSLDGWRAAKLSSVSFHDGWDHKLVSREPSYAGFVYKADGSLSDQSRYIIAVKALPKVGQ
jgi:hypothetical protein